VIANSDAKRDYPQNRGVLAYMGSMAKNASIITVRPRRPGPVLICRKCLKRADDGSKLKRALKSELKRRTALAGGRKPRVVTADCFGICPKRAVVVTSAATLKRGDFLLLADVDASAEAAAILMPDQNV
jgi:predicted metal-binding protein